jgi:hypothetical protein
VKLNKLDGIIDKLAQIEFDIIYEHQNSLSRPAAGHTSPACLPDVVLLSFPNTHSHP